MNKTQQRSYYQAIFNRKDQGLDTDALEEILRLNRRAVSAWERQNIYDNGTQSYYDKQDKIQSNAWDKAGTIAGSNGWKLESNGLGWSVMLNDRDIALPVY
jgi:hypothetical protein